MSAVEESVFSEVMGLLEKSIETADKIYQELPSFIFLLNEHGKILNCNDAGSNFLKQSDRQILMAEIETLYPPLRSVTLLDRMGQTRDRNQTFTTRDEAVEPNTILNWQLKYFHSLSETGRIFLLTGVDATELAKTNEALGRVHKELELANNLQRMLLGEQGDEPEVRLSIDSFYRSANPLGGDWWWKTQVGSRTIILICDVMGHDVAASLITAMLAGAAEAIRGANEDFPPPTEFIQSLRQVVTKFLVNEYYVEAMVIEYDQSTSKATLCGAGISPVYVIQNGRPLRSHVVKGGPLGFRDSEKSNIVEIKLDPGAHIFVATDGLYEIAKRRQVKDYLTKLSLYPQESVLREIVEEFDLEDRPLDDDVTMLLLSQL